MANIRGTYIWVPIPLQISGGLIYGNLYLVDLYPMAYIRALISRGLYPGSLYPGHISGGLYPGCLYPGILSGGIYPGAYIRGTFI